MKTLAWKEAQAKLLDKPFTYLWFGTEWCGDCHMMLPIVEQVQEVFSSNEKVQFIKVDAEEAGLFRKEDSVWQVKRVPTHIFLKEGKIKNIMYEYVPAEVLIEEIDKLRYDEV